ncbi:hypothetical protein [Hymenobacter convexus]|uniref:hypothetical protein n=1 Tax=Hymenobacter sp. CA1UV-4 TaxID=3063782 RepID=UPI002714352D|nr:hypothetical protein [Hymenobacter sp. CA1UV-4]MDO7853885.1 hypothetical protein [Hymenobacter sp. CA1UV-4]
MRFLSLIACLLVAGCNSPAPTTPPAAAAPATGQAPNSAQLFSDYLRTTFRQSLSAKGEHWYVVIPAAGCQGCAHAELHQLATTPWAANVTLVSSGLLRDLTAAERAQLRQRAHLLADTSRRADNTLDRLNLPFASLTGVVRTQNGRVVEFIPFDKNSYQTVFEKLPRSPR